MRSVLLSTIALMIPILLGCRTGYVVADRDTGADAMDSSRGDAPETPIDTGVPMDATEADAALEAATDAALDSTTDAALDSTADAAPDTSADAATDAADGCATVTAFVDSDNDGFGVGPGMAVCPPLMTGFAPASGDCDDDDPDAFPGQPLFFTTPRTSGGYDYDCSGGEQAQYRLEFMCACCDPCTLLRAGYRPPVPRCGEVGTLVTNCSGSGACFESETFTPQPCH